MNRTRKEFIVDSLMLGAAGGLAGCSTLEGGGAYAFACRCRFRQLRMVIPVCSRK